MSYHPVDEITIKRFDQLKVGDRYQQYLWARDSAGGPILSNVRTITSISPAWGITIVRGTRDGGIEFTEEFPNWHKVILVPYAKVK